MPPDQPICRCQGCDLLRPCREYDGQWLCVECSPDFYPVDGAGNELENDVAADGEGSA